MFRYFPADLAVVCHLEFSFQFYEAQPTKFLVFLTGRLCLSFRYFIFDGSFFMIYM